MCLDQLFLNFFDATSQITPPSGCLLLHFYPWSGCSTSSIIIKDTSVYIFKASRVLPFPWPRLSSDQLETIRCRAKRVLARGKKVHTRKKKICRRISAKTRLWSLKVPTHTCYTAGTTKSAKTKLIIQSRSSTRRRGMSGVIECKGRFEHGTFIDAMYVAVRCTAKWNACRMISSTIVVIVMSFRLAVVSLWMAPQKVGHQQGS